MPWSPPVSAQRALLASAVALGLSLVCAALFLPPLAHRTLASVPRSVLAGAALALAVLAHWVLLALGARRMARSVAGWLGLAVLLFPIGGAAALLVLGWRDDGEGAGLRAAGHA